MKKSLTILASILFAAVFTFSFGQSSANLAQPQKVFVSSETAAVEIRPIEVLHDPIKLLGIWADEPVPLSVYTEEEIAIQKDINQQLGKQYAYTYRHIPDEEIYGDNNANIPVELRNIDNEPITPYTWKVVQLRMTEADGSILNAQLRRPNWWIKHHGADRIGNMVRLSIHEMAIEGIAKVINIGANQIDTRVKSFDDDGNYTFRPVTGWFERVSADTWDYTFSNGEVIGSTSNHPFFSEDRQDYVAIGEIKIGERIKVKGEQTAKLVSKTKRATEGEKVYNIEIYRDHNFHVGEEGLLVHNSCPKVWKSLISSTQFDNWITQWGTPKPQNSNATWAQFQKFATGSNNEIEINFSGTKIRADWYDSARNGVIDAKYLEGDYYNIDKYLQTPGIYGNLENEFVRYAQLANNNSSPIAQLIVKINKEDLNAKLLFEYLGTKHNVPTLVEVINWP
jgi:hypothetical protein